MGEKIKSSLLFPEKKTLMHFLKHNMKEPLQAHEMTTQELNQLLHDLLCLLDALLNNPFEKIILTDAEGTILFINESYASLISVEPHEVIGKNAKKVLGKDTRMHIVGQTLKPELHDLFHTANNDAVVRRLPLLSGGRFLGVMGKDLFDNLNDFYKMAKKAEVRYNTLIPGQTLMKKERPHRARYSLDDIITRDPRMLKIKEIVRKTALTSSTVLLNGETGVGKELFAHAIHRESLRAADPFVSVNCGAIPETLLEAELFGYEDGAFTGARKGGKPGKFELANGGTIFLDEIGEIPMVSQAKLLRILQEKELERLGGTSTISVDVRVVASSNKDLWQLLQEGTFRNDLYYRLSVVPITIPPLRERKGDIPVLADHFIQKFNQAFSFQVRSIDSKILKQFKRYSWPGNVRELESAIEFAFNLGGSGAEVLTEFKPFQSSEGMDAASSSLKDRVAHFEADVISKALEGAGGSVEKAAEMLDISTASLYRKIKQLEMQ